MPRLKITVVPSLSRLDLVLKGFTNSKYIGNYQSVFKGQGLEFADFRTYTVNDDAHRIDWKTSARTTEPVVKEFVEERNIDVFFLVDVSSKMVVGSTQKLKAEYVADFVASLSHTMLKAGDRVGVGLFSDKMTKVVYLDNGTKHFYSISESLSNLAYYGGEANIRKAIDSISGLLKTGTIVFLISDFITEENFESPLRIAASKFDITSVIVRDPIDMDLPEGMGQVLVQDPTYGEKILVSPNKVSKYYSLEAKSQLRKTKRAFSRAGVDVIELSTKVPFMNKLIEYFELRKSKWR